MRPEAVNRYRQESGTATATAKRWHVVRASDGVVLAGAVTEEAARRTCRLLCEGHPGFARVERRKA